MAVMKALIYVLVATMVLGITDAKKPSKSTLSIKQLSVPQKPKDWPTLCPTCVSFMDQSINMLLNIILNVGVLGSCQELCGYLPTELEAEVCDLVCAYVGLEAFIALIQYEDPDPVWLCMEIGVCPIKDDAKAQITEAAVSPASGPTGTTFTLSVKFEVETQIGTGEFYVVVIPPLEDGFPFGGGDLLVNTEPGVYGTQVRISTRPTEQEDFGPGVYNYTVALCEGACGSSHSHSFTLSTKKGYFTITP